MARIMDDADVGPRPPAGQLDVFQVVDPVAGALSGRCPAGAVEHDEIALQPQAIIPRALLAPADQIGRAVEAVAHQPDRGPLGQPGNHRVEQRLLGVEPDRASATRQASGKARSPWRSASIRTWWRSDTLDWSKIRTSGWPSAVARSRTSRENGSMISSLTTSGLPSSRVIHW